MPSLPALQASPVLFNVEETISVRLVQSAVCVEPLPDAAVRCEGQAYQEQVTSRRRAARIVIRGDTGVGAFVWSAACRPVVNQERSVSEYKALLEAALEKARSPVAACCHCWMRAAT